MVRLFLHIGAPKTGTTALQHTFNDNRSALAEAGLTYVTPGKRSSANQVAIALNRKRTDQIAEQAEELTRKVEEAPGDVLISSEMFFARSPEFLRPGLPMISPETTTLLVWLKRQDLYIESKYLQRAKNGRFVGDIWRYLERFEGSGADYEETLRPWIDAGYPIEARLSERHIVDDALEVLGLAGKVDLSAAPRENSSPSRLRLDLLQIAAAVGHPNPRRLQRSLPPDTAPKARILTNAERRDLLARFAASNEAIRARFFPERATLFDTSDLEDTEPPEDPPLSEAQRDEIARVFKAFRDTLG